MSGGGNSSADPSLLVVETKSNESIWNRSGGGSSTCSATDKRYEKQQHQHEVERENEVYPPLYSLPPRPEVGSGVGSRTALAQMYMIADGVGPDKSSNNNNNSGNSSGGRDFISEVGRDDGDANCNKIPIAEEQECETEPYEEYTTDTEDAEGEEEDGNNNNNNNNNNDDGDDDDDMAERVLHTLQRKDELLEEQARCLERRELEAVQLRRELAVLLEEKQLLMQQLRGFLSTAVSQTNAESLDLDPAQSVSKQEEEEQQENDAVHLRAHIHHLTTQLTQTQRDAKEQKRKHAHDLNAIQHEMREFSTLVEMLHSTKSALRRTQKQLEEATEAKVRSQLERDRFVRTLQDAIQREREEHQRTVQQLEAEAHTLRRTVTTMEEKYRAVEMRHVSTQAELHTLRLELEALRSGRAALLLQVEAAESLLQRQQEHGRTACVEQQQLQTALDAALRELEQLRLFSTAHTDDDTRAAERQKNQRCMRLCAEVAQCVRGTAELEAALAHMEERCRVATERETHMAAERDGLRIQLQQHNTAARRELLEQQQLAEEMATFHRVKLQQQQVALTESRRCVDELSHECAVARETQATLQTALTNSQQQRDDALEELQHMREDVKRLERTLTEVREAYHTRTVQEKEAMATVEALRKGLRQREEARRRLKRKVQRLEESEERRRVVEASAALLQTARPHKHATHTSNGMERTPSTTAAAVGCPLGGNPNRTLVELSRGKLQDAETRNAKLEQQLSAKSNSERALLEDRKSLQQQLLAQQRVLQEQFTQLDRRHREEMRQLEETHRRRITVVCEETRQEAERRVLCAQQGMARVVDEMMLFVHSLEEYASDIMRRLSLEEPTIEETEKKDGLEVASLVRDEEENMVRAVCDEITRNFLGVEGGWDALLQQSRIDSTSMNVSIEKKGGRRESASPFTAALQRRMRGLLLEYLQKCMLPVKPRTTGGKEMETGRTQLMYSRNHNKSNNNCSIITSSGKPFNWRTSLRRPMQTTAVSSASRCDTNSSIGGSRNTRKPLGVTFAVPCEVGNEASNNTNNDGNCSERPLVDLLMECVRSAFAEGHISV